MKKTPLLNAELSHIVATMGHTDGLCLADAGFPIPRAVAGPQRIDLAVSPSLPSFVEVLDVILTELVVERIVLAEEIRQQNPKILGAVLKRLAGVKLSYIPTRNSKRPSRMFRQRFERVNAAPTPASFSIREWCFDQQASCR